MEIAFVEPFLILFLAIFFDCGNNKIFPISDMSGYI